MATQQHQNPDEFSELRGSQEAENLRRGTADADNLPHEQQTQQPTGQAHAPHQSSPNYGEFGGVPGGTAVVGETANNFQPRYGQETPPEDASQTKRGDERFRQSGTQNIDTNEPANPHHGPEGA
ncbi:hypothetical protein F0P96_05255 [Hymenobacter busanensis]|uniref:Uncharacterized protein n=1 Tax=Hymenobacter busanensis TaxID=2607656 RepID=A0A7L5A2Q1_9BACT|nr:hypothetical protein [Hymenobacter busanensis]KAA9338252.1 hypothetical protein F0P96_05255 [Hymenobacter busanensis]QHJ09325.1 hypothetical protein GUY19_19360 [Hymenobacter busanensis]